MTSFGWLQAMCDEAVDERAAAQDRHELYIAGTILANNPPRRVLEIGTASGGSLWFWSQVSDYRGKIASVDVSHHDLHPENTPPLWETQQEWYLHLGDSRHLSSRDAVRDFLDDPVDFLFIDGDHSYTVSMLDYDLYSPLVRPGGWIGFHDIQGPYVEDGGSWRTWCELRDRHPNDHVEIQLRPEGGMGIGLLRKR